MQLTSNILWLEGIICDADKAISKIKEKRKLESRKRLLKEEKLLVISCLIIKKRSQKKIDSIIQNKKIIEGFFSNHVPNPTGGGSYNLKNLSLKELLSLKQEIQQLSEESRNPNHDIIDYSIKSTKKEIKKRIICFIPNLVAKFAGN